LAVLKTTLKALGLDEDRVWVRWISAAEGPKFAQTMREFTEAMKKKGPSPFKDSWSV
jgi:coenzyme F420-reducing hydrogenase delta subunit